MSRNLAIAMVLAVLVLGAGPAAAFAAVPTNDNFAVATSIGALPYADNVNNQDATTEPGENACYGSIYRTVWYEFTAASNSHVRVVATGAYSTVLAIYRVDAPGFAGLTALSCSAFQFPSGAVVGVAAGTTYKIQVGQYSDDGGTNIGLQVSEVPAPGNDAFVAASTFAAVPFVDSNVEIIAASTEPGEPSSCLGQETPRTVWYRYTPTTSSSITLYADGPGNASIKAFTGSQLAALTALGCQYNRATFHVDAGVTYSFQIDGVGGAIPAWTVRVEQTPAVQVSIGTNPSDPSSFDNVTIYGQIYDPVNQGVASETWTFGDGSSGTGSAPLHRYAKDGDYQVHLDLVTTDGRTASATQTIQVRTHDIGITKFDVPASANVGQTRQISVGIKNGRYPETVQVQLFKSNLSGGFDLVGTLYQSVPVRAGNRTTDFSFNYTFTSGDATPRKVTFRADAVILSARDAFPADNQAIAAPTKVAK